MFSEKKLKGYRQIHEITLMGDLYTDTLTVQNNKETLHAINLIKTNGYKMF